VLGHAVLGPIADAGRFADCRFVNGISSLESFRAIPESCVAPACRSTRFETVVHPRATVSPARRSAAAA
jgi:hypothetical protein